MTLDDTGATISVKVQNSSDLPYQTPAICRPNGKTAKGLGCDRLHGYPSHQLPSTAGSQPFHPCERSNAPQAVSPKTQKSLSFYPRHLPTSQPTWPPPLEKVEKKDVAWFPGSLPKRCFGNSGNPHWTWTFIRWSGLPQRQRLASSPADLAWPFRVVGGMDLR